MEENKKADTLSEEIEKYIKRGFGSMNKNDFEVYIFHKLLVSDENCKGLSDFKISQYLKLPEAKVKRLRYEAELKYGDGSMENYREALKVALKLAKCQEGSDEGKVTMSIPDKILRQYLSDILIEDGRFMDGSFYSNVVTMSAGNFVYVLEQIFLDKRDKKRLIDEAKKNIEDGKKMPKSFSESLAEMGIIISKSVLEKIIGTSTDKLFDTLKDLINNKSK